MKLLHAILFVGALSGSLVATDGVSREATDITSLSNTELAALAVAYGAPPSEIASSEAVTMKLNEFKSRRYIPERTAELKKVARRMKGITLKIPNLGLGGAKFDFERSAWLGCPITMIAKKIAEHPRRYPTHVGAQIFWPSSLQTQRNKCGPDWKSSMLPDFDAGGGLSPVLKFKIRDLDLAERMEADRRRFLVDVVCRPAALRNSKQMFASRTAFFFGCVIDEGSILLHNQSRSWGVEY